MGWWKNSADGTSFDENSEFIWGDGVADIIEDALYEVEKLFIETWGRSPWTNEMRAGIMFSLACYQPSNVSAGAEVVQVPGMLNILPDGEWK